MGILLGTQGLVGWIMVASGLKPGMTAVAPVKLALHLTLASLFFAALIATYVRQGGAALEPASLRRRLLLAAPACSSRFVQIALGGLVAGSHAGLVYGTWPLMDGRLRAERPRHASSRSGRTSSPTSRPSSSTIGSAPMS